MRTLYKNPRDLATCLKDLVDQHLDQIMTYEKLEEKVCKLADANEERFYKNGMIDNKISMILESSRVDIINKILEDRKN